MRLTLSVWNRWCRSGVRQQRFFSDLELLWAASLDQLLQSMRCHPNHYWAFERSCEYSEQYLANLSCFYFCLHRTSIAASCFLQVMGLNSPSYVCVLSRFWKAPCFEVSCPYWGEVSGCLHLRHAELRSSFWMMRRKSCTTTTRRKTETR